MSANHEPFERPGLEALVAGAEHAITALADLDLATMSPADRARLRQRLGRLASALVRLLEPPRWPRR